MTPIGILLLFVIALVVAARVKQHNRCSRQKALICANVKQTMRANYERSVKERQAAWRQYDNGHYPDDNYPKAVREAAHPHG
jgi:hypothetical protein